MSGGSKKDTPDAPTPPDYKELIKEQAKQNRINTTTPYGSTRFSQNEDGTWNQVTEIDPRLQDVFSRQINMAKGGLGDGNYDKYQDMAMAMASEQLDPVYDRQWNRMEQTMANRGTPVGSEVYSDQFRELADSENRAYRNAAFDALKFGSNLRSADDARTLQDYNMLASVLGNVQAQPATPIDVMGASQLQQNQIMNNYNQQLAAANASRSNFWNAGGLLGSSAIGAFG